MGDTQSPSPHPVVQFWRQAGRDLWFAKNEAFDTKCRGFEALWRDAAAGQLAAWEAEAEPALALVLLLDQMPRNMFRGTPRAYETDPQARAAADRAILGGFDLGVEPALRLFFYLPFAHSEAMADQHRSVALAQATGDADLIRASTRHHDIVARFGRFPHRNILLGRVSTPEEVAWLASEGAFRG
ncbi:MAG: DUF924 family protein [Alphaproteobacteria bacterium]|nr:DUF924 family protein [Alphaproteobacteria bacterium]